MGQAEAEREQKSAVGSPPPTKRLGMEARRKQMICAATAMFAEHGFTANTTMLAHRLGVTQPLLYRYFRSKAELVEAVLEQVFQKQAEHDWLSVIRDRGTPLRERIINFSYRYATTTYTREWIRLYMFAGLDGGEFNRRFISHVTEPLLTAIAAEIKQDLGFSSRRGSKRSKEIDLLWLFHGGLYYVAIRKHIYGFHVDDDSLLETIRFSVDTLINGIVALNGADR